MKDRTSHCSREKAFLDDIIAKRSSKKKFCILNLNEVVKAYAIWKKELPNVELFYAIKANPLIEIVKQLDTMGASFDCASKGELETVKNTLKWDEETMNKKVVYSNPVKATFDLSYAADVNVQLTVADTVCELEKIKEFHPNARVMIRMKTNDKGSISTLSEKFGCPLNEVDTLLKVGKQLGINFVGVAFHVGSGSKDGKSFWKAMKDARKIFDMAAMWGYEFNILDIGGGFPGNKPELFLEMTQGIRKGQELFNDNVRYIAEPGRYIAQNCCTLVNSVIGKGVRNNKAVYYLNDGVYSAFSIVVFENLKITENHVEVHKDAHGKLPTYNSVLFGPTCDSFDCLTHDIQLPTLNVGDWLVWRKFGAYTTTSASTFNGFDPVEVFVLPSD